MSAGPLVLNPPLEVMRPRAVSSIPSADDLPGGVRYEVKLDGYRCLAFARGAQPPVLQSRSGRNMAGDFPALADSVALLPAGVVLDGEICAWQDGRLTFGALRSPSADVSLALVVFDLLALPGRDVRALPLRERVALMAETLTPMPPAIQPVMATNDKTEARSWYDVLQPQGIEGLVCKALDSPYQPHASARHWLKVRHQDTIDAEFVAFIGTPRRPRTLVLRLADGSQVLTSPQLDPVQARTVAEQLTGLVDDPLTDPALGTVHPLNVPLTAEVLAGSGRHATYRFLRLRTDQ